MKSKVYKKLPAKQLNKQFINGPMLSDLAIAYCKALNQGVIPKINSAWEYMVDSENTKGLETAFKSLSKQIESIIPDLPMSDDLLLNYKNTVFKN